MATAAPSASPLARAADSSSPGLPARNTPKAVSLLGWFGTVEAPPEPGPDAHDAGPAAGMPLPTAASSPPARTGPLAGTPRQQAVTGLGNEPPLAPAAPAPIAPSFDIVRVEPNGDSVIAGRAAPGAAVELLRDGETHFRALADESGRFAVVPSPLPPGSHTIVLQSVAPDGTRARSRGSVTVAIADNKTTPRSSRFPRLTSLLWCCRIQ